MLSDVSLVTEKRKPFDRLAKRLEIDDSRADWIRTSDLHHPKVARYPDCATARNEAIL